MLQNQQSTEKYTMKSLTLTVPPHRACGLPTLPLFLASLVCSLPSLQAPHHKVKPNTPTPQT